MTGEVPVFCICGPSAAGKTTFTLAIAKGLANRGITCLVISCDNYYRNNWQPHPLFGFDTVDAIDMDMLRRDLVLTSRRQATSLRFYDMRYRHVVWRDIDCNYEVILLEGAYGPQDLIGDFPLAGLTYLHQPLLLRLFRRLRRDVRERNRPAKVVVRQMLREMLPGERSFIHPLRRQADLVVSNPSRGVEILIHRILNAL